MSKLIRNTGSYFLSVISMSKSKWTLNCNFQSRLEEARMVMLQEAVRVVTGGWVSRCKKNCYQCKN